jgi:hypothetical protein
LIVQVLARQEIFLCDTSVRPTSACLATNRTIWTRSTARLAEHGRRSCGAGVARWRNATVPSEVRAPMRGQPRRQPAGAAEKQRCRAEQAGVMYLAHARRLVEDDLLFSTREGIPIPRNTIRTRVWTPAVKASGTPASASRPPPHPRLLAARRRRRPAIRDGPDAPHPAPHRPFQHVYPVDLWVAGPARHVGARTLSLTSTPGVAPITVSAKAQICGLAQPVIGRLRTICPPGCPVQGQRSLPTRRRPYGLTLTRSAGCQRILSSDGTSISSNQGWASPAIPLRARLRGLPAARDGNVSSALGRPTPSWCPASPNVRRADRRPAGPKTRGSCQSMARMRPTRADRRRTSPAWSGSMVPVVLSAPYNSLGQPHKQTACTDPSPRSWRVAAWCFMAIGFL